jgi:hypothetical protein
MDPSKRREEAVPPDTMPSDEVSIIFPSRVKKELNLESSSLTVESEASTSSFHVVNDLSKFAAASSSRTMYSSRCCASVDSSVMHVLKTLS